MTLNFDLLTDKLAHRRSLLPWGTFKWSWWYGVMEGDAP